MKHIRQRIDKPNLCGTTDMPYLTVRAAQIRQRDGRTDGLCPACVAALDAREGASPEKRVAEALALDRNPLTLTGAARLRAALRARGITVEIVSQPPTLDIPSTLALARDAAPGELIVEIIRYRDEIAKAEARALVRAVARALEKGWL